MKLDMTRGALHATLFLFVFTLVLFAANILFTAHEVNSIRANTTHIGMAVQAQCHFNSDLAGLPLAVNPKTGKAALLGVKIIADARLAWRVLGCPGTLPPPSPSFAKWARYYHQPAT